MRNRQYQVGIVLLSLLAGFMGGWVSRFFGANPAFAASPPNAQVVYAQEFQLKSKDGRTLARWTSTTDEGGPSIWFYDANGKIRLQVGLYPDGLPLVGLFNEKFEAKALLRLAGGNGSPVLVMKNNNQDRIILGLDLQNSKEPFLVHFDEDGKKHLEFGNY